jgi:hypothetical protein
MSDQPYTEETRAEDGHLLRKYEDGTIYDRTAKKLIHGPTNAMITKANAREFAQRRKDIALISTMRGLAEGTGVELPEDDNDLLALARGAGSGIQKLTAHMSRVFLSSKNVRGLSEAYGRLVSPHLGEPETDARHVIYVQNNFSPETASAMERVLRDVIRAQQEHLVIDAESVDIKREGE